MASIMPVRNETKSTSTRITKEGRKLTYKLSVMQQPERARACGSGAKSSADRRPVDPPPVVELRIFEGEAMNDITFSYNANFFLFATLENARPIAHGRVAQTAPSFPILTGMPVSGMAYLDRPTPAGYFIFPDLSVRHEGKYRLGFTLYEEVKEPKDADSEPAMNHPDHPTNQAKVANPLAPKAHVDWRLEVKSKPFTVFSAKKFPGLAESTALSRIVAEQGCRVRIRRDVRMRRREKAPEYEEYDEDAGYMRSRATPTPDPYRQATPIQAAHPTIDAGRQRSPSAGSVGGRTPYGMDQHRGSVPDQAQYGSQYQQGYGAGPQGAAGAYPPHLSFGGAPNSHYATPAYGAAQSPAAVQPTPGYAQPQMSYFPQAPNHQYAPQQSAPTHHMRHGSGEISGTPRRGSVSYPQPPSYASQAAPSHGYSYSEASYGRPQPQQQQQQQPPAYQPYQNGPAARAPTPASNAHSLPPLKMALPVEAKSEAVSSPAGPPPNGWAGSTERSPELDGIAVKEGGFTEYSTGPTSVGAHVNERTRTSKRPFGSVFDAAQHDQSYRNGMRPGEEQTGLEASQPTYDEDEFDSAYELQQMKMQYKRADGTEISRRLPAVA